MMSEYLDATHSLSLGILLELIYCLCTRRSPDGRDEAKISSRHSPDAIKVKTRVGLTKQPLPVPLLPLTRIEQLHHSQVEASDQPLLVPSRRPGLGHDKVRHEDPRPGLQRRDQRPQQLQAVLVRPVVEDPAEVVDVGAVHGLVLEEVVGHEGDAVGQRGGDRLSCLVL